MKLNYAIAFVSDMAKSVAFYRDVIGLTVEFESGEWTQFRTGDATFALHKGDTDEATISDINKPGLCRPGFSVTDLESFHQRLLQASVPCIQEPRNVFGVQIAQYADPDGLIISISQQ